LRPGRVLPVTIATLITSVTPRTSVEMGLRTLPLRAAWGELARRPEKSANRLL